MGQLTPWRQTHHRRVVQVPGNDFRPYHGAPAAIEVEQALADGIAGSLPIRLQHGCCSLNAPGLLAFDPQERELLGGIQRAQILRELERVDDARRIARGRCAPAAGRRAPPGFVPRERADPARSREAKQRTRWR